MRKAMLGEARLERLRYDHQPKRPATVPDPRWGLPVAVEGPYYGRPGRGKGPAALADDLNAQVRHRIERFAAAARDLEALGWTPPRPPQRLDDGTRRRLRRAALDGLKAQHARRISDALTGVGLAHVKTVRVGLPKDVPKIVARFFALYPRVGEESRFAEGLRALDRGALAAWEPFTRRQVKDMLRLRSRDDARSRSGGLDVGQGRGGVPVRDHARRRGHEPRPLRTQE